ncbi:hypothetical protein [Natrinema sp. 74]|uniref:DUF7350 domain-containing protein n=1 Tax=Natrinema sp. 74 TaxID=3384159 RepID=UPI0038D43CB4
MKRRTLLRRTTALSSAIALAGCAAPSGERNETENDDDEAGSGGTVTGTPAIPRVENPPQAVYLPGHHKSMRVLEPVDAGDYRLAPMLTYPHPFWLVTGAERQPVEPAAGRGVHLMCTVWDPETDTVLPTSSPRVTLERAAGGARVTSRSLWPMLSQEMGLHFGDNVVLPADGTYTAEIELPPIRTRRTGSLAGRFAERATATFEFTYDAAFREAVVEGIDLLERERWGKRGALEPMLGREGRAGGDGPDGDGNPTAGIPYSALPPAEDYPGTQLVESSVPTGVNSGSTDGLPTSGDATFVVTLLEPGSRRADADDRYLLVAPRTPYNRVPLPNTSLRAVVSRDGTTMANRGLEATLDGDLGFHYGLALADVRAGDSVRIVVESPPQTARHQGYETAFFEMEPLELAVPDVFDAGR